MENDGSFVFSAWKGRSETEEFRWREYQKTKNPQLRQHLILENIRLVYYAYGRMNVHLPYGMEKEDAISYGITGLIEAIDRYKVEKGRFSSLAYPRIQGAIYDGMIHFQWLKRQDHRQCRQWVVIPLDKAVEAAEESLEKAPEYNLMRENNRSVLEKGMQELEGREKEILQKHYFEGQTLRQIARETGRSTSRVSELHRKGLSALEAKLKNKEIF